MTESETPRDPRAMDEEELAQVPEPPLPADPSAGSEAVAEEAYDEGKTTGSGGADREAPAGEDYAGSGF